MKKIRKFIIITIAIFFIAMTFSYVQAKENSIEQQIENYAKDIDISNISTEDILKAYDELSEKYSNEEIANMIEEHKEEIKDKGVSEEVISAGTNFLKTTDTEAVREIIKNDINLEEIQNKIEQGYTVNQALQNAVQETPNDKKIEIFVKLLLANKIVRTILLVAGVLFVYGTILRWILYKKAGRNGWAAIIPVYRQIVMYQICGLSLWLMLLWLIPIFGWIVMLIIAIMKRFCLSNAFGKGALFGFGILLLPPIFQSILAFNPNIEYEGERNRE